ncbi:hypothetical protein KAFR_0L00580 [Kazachstania africana CBS 2517]|uniref:CAP-Gly domain-containing protein n=1 Tax=Kazachstania africana (strain ATCC 22294 / BCRC 22015 / CBS 2517 / CECT 1963 / NBRC 1671 / NRRL Y-8276) TaxID=1071382 RepID=H2B215_KAZAF|nr:hypothetical protein KAFR_0L00580 [Kazachstania africana CBS 2517]CCF60665.1 hypothetical protein KAFR_0L00580 [Kazachstania africana CBS 2517]
MGYQIGDRLMVDDELCTIKYIGPIREWSTAPAYGVEWDNPKRGKHSGTISGIQYFTTRLANAGSFLKEAKVKGLRRKSFYKALTEIYGDSQQISNSLYLGAKKIEGLGFDALNERNRRLHDLKSISLQKESIYIDFSDEKERNYFVSQCPNVISLDLGQNLVSDFNNLCDALGLMKNLKTLNLSGNHFSRNWDRLNNNNLTFPNLKSLFLVSCNLNLQGVNSILNCFPGLQVLDLSGNHFQCIDQKLHLPESLVTLNLSDNALKSFPQGFEKWNLEELCLADNDITIIKKRDDFSAAIKNLNLSNNRISKWAELDILNTSFPYLEALIIHANPLFTFDETDQSEFYQIIARFDGLKVLDGSPLSSDLIKEAELYFVSKIRNGEITYNKDLKRWKHFNESYVLDNYQNASKKLPRWLDGELETITMIYEEKDLTFSISVLSTYTVRYLKGIISSKLSKKVLQIKLYRNLGKGLEEIDKEFSQLRDLSINSENIIYIKSN